MCFVRLQFSKWWWVVSVLSILLPHTESAAKEIERDDPTDRCLCIDRHWNRMRAIKMEENKQRTDYGTGLHEKQRNKTKKKKWRARALATKCMRKLVTKTNEQRKDDFAFNWIYMYLVSVVNRKAENKCAH